MGADMIVLTGNPGIGVQNKAITASLKAIAPELGDKVILVAGKMHASGILSEAGRGSSPARTFPNLPTRALM